MNRALRDEILRRLAETPDDRLEASPVYRVVRQKVEPIAQGIHGETGLSLDACRSVAWHVWCETQWELVQAPKGPFEEEAARALEIRPDGRILSITGPLGKAVLS